MKFLNYIKLERVQEIEREKKQKENMVNERKPVS